MVCARIGLADLPIDIGYLVHHVAAVRLALLTELDARALLVHCSQEMTHLVSFLPALYR